MLFSKLSDKKKKIIGYILPCVVIIFMPSFDVLLSFLGSWEAFRPYAILGMMFACVWFLLISPALIIISAVCSQLLAKPRVSYNALMVVLFFILSSLMYQLVGLDARRICMFYLCVRVVCFSLTYVITRLVRK